MFTNLDVKLKHFPEFYKEVWGRLEKGKLKYQLKYHQDKEATDLLAEEDPIYQAISAKKYISEYLICGDPKCLFDAAGSIYIQFLQDYEKFKKDKRQD
jgi:hypothetical protein